MKTQFSSERSSVDPGAKVPNFVGVGPPKCATTWLDAMLRQHPQVFLPKHQKEVFYFDRYHDRGDDWYKALFKAARDQTAIGEISTSYLASSDALDRLHAFNPDVKIVIILRHPVARMVSHFRMLRENGRTKENFEASVGHYSVLRNASSYAANLAHLFSLFPREQVHLAIYEEIFADPDATSGYLTSLQNFLGVLPHDGQAAAGKTKVRETMGAPRSDWLIKRAKKTRRRLRQCDLEWVVSAAARIGIDRRLFLKKGATDPIPAPVLSRLCGEMAGDMAYVETLLGRDIPAWQEAYTN